MDKAQQKRVKQRFGARLRQLRKAKGMSQEAVALACDLDRSFLGGIERGERNVSLVNIHRVADALQVKPGTYSIRIDRALLRNWGSSHRHRQ